MLFAIAPYTLNVAGIRIFRTYNMRMTKILFLLATLFLSQQWCGTSYGYETPEPETLLNIYHQNEKDLQNSPFTVPFHLESTVKINGSLVDIYGTVKYPFSVVENEFKTPTNWCDIVMPHINVRACTTEKASDTWLLTIYNVDRFDEPIEDAYKMKFEYRVAAQQPGYLKILLDARDGPFSTKAHLFMLEAIALNEDVTFLHFRYAFNYGFFGYIALKSYFLIFDSGKTGFSVAGTDSAGNVTYVGGFRGAMERTVLLYYLAIPAHLDTRDIHVEQRFEKRIGHWYDLTTQHKERLPDMEKEEYLTRKRQDRKDQLKLQSAIGR